MLDKNVDTYSQKEIALDAVTFTGATVAATLASKIHLVNPLSVGTFLLTGANILALAATKKALDHLQIESKFLRACAIITTLALTTLAIPFAIGTLCGASIAILSLEVALTTTLLHLATKVATYGLFKGGLLFKNFFFFSFPSSIQELTSMPQSRLEKVKKHLHDHPEKTTQIPLLFQLTLNQQLQANDIDPLPLQNFSERGENWTQNLLKQLHKEDLHDLPLEKRAAVAELFLYHNFPPQDRPYEKDELPGIDYGTFDKKLSASQLLWVHLITRLNPEAPVYEPIAKQFYRLELTPPRDAWIDLPIPTSTGEVQNLNPCQILWYVNFFQAKPKEWQNLSLPIQEAFNECFETQRPISHAPPKEVPSLFGRVKKEITWKRAAIAGGALAVTALLATYYFRPDLFPSFGWQKPIDLATNKILTPSSSPVPSASLPENSSKRLSSLEQLFYSPLDAPQPEPMALPSPPAILPAKRLSSLEQLFHSPIDAPQPEPMALPSPPSIVSATNLSVPEQPFCLPQNSSSLPSSPIALPENFTPPEQPLVNHSPTLALPKTEKLVQELLAPEAIRPELPPQIRLSSRVADFAYAQFKSLIWTLAPPALLAIPLLWTIRSCRRQEPDPRAPLVSDKEELMKSTHALRIEVPEKGEYAFDLRDPIIKSLFEEYLRKAEEHTGIRIESPPLKITYGDFSSTSPIVRLIKGAVDAGFIEAALKAIETRPLPPAEMEEELAKAPFVPPDFFAPELVVREDKKDALMKREDVLGIEVSGEERYAFDLRNPAIRELFEEYQQEMSELPRSDSEAPNPFRIFLDGKILTISDPAAVSLCREFIERVQPAIPRLLSKGMEEEKVTKKLDWSAIEKYVSEYCPGVSPAKAKEMIREGLLLIQQLRKNEKVEQTDLDHKLAAVCWGLMAHSITKGRSFEEGTTDISDPGNRIFHFFLPTLYGRASSHYKQRTIAFEDGPWRGYGHFGLDTNELPAGKRTVMMGRLQNRDGSHRTYLKMENNGANLNFRTDPRALANFPQVLAHTLEFFESQGKRQLPSIFGEVGGGLHMHKEHMLRADREMIGGLIRRAREADASLGIPSSEELDEYGFQVAVPFLASLTTNPKLSTELTAEIQAYIDHLHVRYDGLPHRKGDEDIVDESIMEYSSLGTSDLSESEEISGFEELSPSEESISDWDIAYNRLLSTDVLSNHSVKIFGDLLESDQKCTFVPDLLIPGIAESQRNLGAYLQNLFHKAAERTRDKRPIFIPLILENPSKRIPYLGSYFRDHMVVLTYQNGNWEYYDSRGVKFENETRKILGLNISPLGLLNALKEEEEEESAAAVTVKSNLTPHLRLTDWVNCGPFACNYMWQRTRLSLEEIPKTSAIDPTDMRLELAAHLKRRHAPPALKEASHPADITARLDSEHARCLNKRASKLLKENAEHYLTAEGIDKDRIFTQIDKDLSRPGEGMSQFMLNGIVYDGSKGKDAYAIFQELLKTRRDEREILTLMTLLQQGVFGSIEMAIWKDLDILDPESGMQIRGQGSFLARSCKEKGQTIRTYNIRTERSNILLDCSSYYEVIASDLEKATYREVPYGILEALVQLDLDAGTASESWQVKEAIE